MTAAATRPRWLLLAVALGALATWLAGGLDFADADAGRGARALGVTTVVATCWLSGALPLGAASLLPLALFPLLDVVPMTTAAHAYAAPIIWLFFGGFVLAQAIERFGLHRRFALHVILAVGVRPRRLVLGFLLASLLLSMWINNTATTLMLMPIGLALVDRLCRESGLDGDDGRRFGIALMLAIAYGSSIGGTSTKVGTAPNLLLFGQLDQLAAKGAPPTSFAQWFLVFAPLALALGLSVWWVLVRVLFRVPASAAAPEGLLREELARLGPVRTSERRVLALFVTTIVLWVTRADLPIGDVTIPGWTTWIGLSSRAVTDGTVAMAMALLAFVVPSGEPDRPRLMDWPTAMRIPFDILFLLGGGVAIAQVLQDTAVCDALARAAEPWMRAAPAPLAILMLVFFVTFLTEVTSNTAITSLMLPLLLALAASSDHLDPRALMIPATVAASFAFMLPIATPPNAVVFASGRLRMLDMARAGVVFNLLGIAALTAYCLLVAFPLLGIDPGSAPAWWHKIR